MSDTIKLRLATSEDFDQVLEVFHSAWDPTPWFTHAFPRSDPASAVQGRDTIRAILGDRNSIVLVAEETATLTDSGKPYIVGWVRWIRRLPAGTGNPHAVMKLEDYPRSGDQHFALRVRKTSAEALQRYIGPQEPCWYCSGMATRAGYQRKGIGAMMVRWGIEKADEEGWLAYVTGTNEAKSLYEKSGFVTVDSADMGYGVVLWFMRRETRSTGDKHEAVPEL